MMNYKEKLDGLVKEGWLISQVHPTLDLTIYNYSQKTQYEGYWNEDTLSARGIVLNSKGKVVTRPFNKFFNAEEVKPEDMPYETFEVYEKMDGSLGIFFWYVDDITETLHPVFASRGSFTSEQAVKGWEMLQKLPYRELVYGHTHMFEIIYPENRIVVNYGDVEKLVLLGVIETASGREISRINIEEHLGNSFELVKMYNFTDSWKELKGHNEDNREGYVLRYANGFRMKVKFEEYVRLHRIITQISTTDIWEMLKNNEPMDKLLEMVPDEFYNWVRMTVNELNSSYEMLENEYKWIFKILNRSINDRKTFAEYALKYKYPSLLFSMLDGRDYSQNIWKLIKPNWSKPFKDV
jgi:RNA ligase